MSGENIIRRLLAERFREARSRNPSYSMRAMAGALSTSPAQLSQVISGKRPMTKKFVLKVAEKLGLSIEEACRIVDGQATTLFEPISEEKFKLVADWQHFAILSLSKTSDCRADPKWIAKRLGIDYFLAKEAFERLCNLGLIEVKNGRYYQSSKPLHTANDIPSMAIRKHHKQNLDMAAIKLDEVEVEKKEFSSMTIAVNPRKLPIAKELIRKFKTQIYDILESGEKEEVYTLSIQLFPVTQLKRGKK